VNDHEPLESLSILVARHSSPLAHGARNGRRTPFPHRSEGFLSAAIGLAIGMFVTLALMRAIRSMLVGLDSAQPGVLLLSLTLVVAAAVVASWIPARRASQVDPMIALRHQ
jgi:putative ABC transport system permease protein